MLEVKDLVKIYKTSKNDEVRALDNVSINFPEHGLVFLLGKSGSGKSTLLNTIGGLDKFDSGEIIVKGKSSKNFSQSDFDSYRNTFIGFIFQEYNVLEEFTVAKNIALALELQGKKATKDAVESLLKQVEMEKFAKRKPNQLSGGQKQRIAIARALIKNPEIIMADEPTGALDSKTGEQVMETLKHLSKEKLVIIVSHDQDFAERYGDRIVELKDGKIISDTTKKEVEPQKTKSGISIIDNNILHIKKGQQVTQSDLDAICKSIVNHTKNGDTFISLDPKTNEDIKKSQFITDDGNREVFKPTEHDDVDLKKYDGNNLKLIKSHLKFKDSFKMGASALKSKVGKLVFTILLSFVAFAIFGIVNTFASFNRPASTWETIKTNKETSVALRKEIVDDEGDGYYQKFTQKDLDALKEKFPDFEFDAVISSTKESSYNTSDMTQFNIESTSLNSTYISGVTDIDDAKLTRLGFELIKGTLPSNDDEICITKYMYDQIAKSSLKTEFSDYETFLTYMAGKKVNLYTNNNSNSSAKRYKVVGIIDPKVDISKYEKDAENSSGNISGMIDSETFETILSSGYVNMIFTTANTKNSLRLLNTTIRKDISIDSNGSGYEPDVSSFLADYESIKGNYGFTNYTEYVSRKVVYYKNGGSVLSEGVFVTLQDDEILVTDYMLRGMANLEMSEIRDKIDDGTLTIRMGDDRSEQNSKPYKVVGLLNSSYGGAGVIVSQNYYDSELLPLIQGYDYVITKLTSNESLNKKLVKYCETVRNSTKYTVQNGSTVILDNFGSTIIIMAQVFLYVGIGFAVFASLLLMSFISTSISYKRREIGILRALGARGSDVFGIFFNESLIIAFINFVLASITTVVTSLIINSVIINKLGLNITLLVIGPQTIGIILGVSILSAFLASLIPVIKIAKKKPIDAINNR